MLNSAVVFVIFILVVLWRQQLNALRCYMCDESLNHKEIECLDKLASCIIVTAEIHEMNKSMVVKGCQSNCVESRLDVETNLTLTTECCSEHLCNLLSRTQDALKVNQSSDQKNSQTSPIALVRIDPVDWLDLLNQTVSEIDAEIGIKNSTLNSTTSSNSRDRLITTFGGGLSPNCAIAHLSLDRFFLLFYSFVSATVLNICNY